jgi:hypothetical protein
VAGHPLKSKKQKKVREFGGGRATPILAVWGGRNHPQARATPKRPRNQKKKKFGFWGWPVTGSPPKALGVARPPPDRPYGVVRPPLKGLETKNKKKGLNFGGGQWPDHPQRP